MTSPEPQSALAPASAAPQADFEHSLRESLAQLRASLFSILETVGANLRVPHQITRQFGIDKSLAAKLARVVRESDPFSAALDVPGEEAMRIFSRAMRDAGAPQASLESLRESVDSFQQMIRTHCGDRATFEMIASSASPARSFKQQQQLETLRKHMFRGSSAVFGVQTRLQLSAQFVAPSRDQAGRTDVAMFNGLIDFRRIRSDVAWAVSSMRNLAPDGSALPTGAYEPIDPEARNAGDGPLLREFCSSPSMKLQTTPGPNSSLRFELPDGPVGATHSLTVFTGWIHRNVGERYRTPDDHVGEHFTALTTPAELTIQDFFVHRDLEYAHRPEVCLYGQLPGAVAYPNGPRDRGLLPMSETLENLSGMPPQPMTAEYANYPAIVQRVAERLGHRLEDFYGVRIQLRFPPVPSMLLYRYELPERPAE
jgi:hypothetical protein